MADISNINRLTEQFGILRTELERYDSSLAKLSRGNGKFIGEMDRLAKQLVATGGGVKFLLKGNNELTKSLSDQIKKMRENETEARRLSVAYALITFKVGDFSTKMKMSAKAIDGLSSGFRKLTAAASQGSGSALYSFDAISKELVKFNRNTFEASRQLQSLGKAFDTRSLTKMASAANLSRTQMVELIKVYNEIGLSSGRSADQIGKLATLIKGKFGGSAEVVSEITRRFGELDSVMPGVVDDMIRFSETGKTAVGNMGSMLLTMKGLGANTRQLQTLVQAYTSLTKEQQDLLTYETKIQEKNKAIADANLAVGKTSEVMLSNIEGGIAKLVQVGEKLVGGMKGLPLIFIALKAVGISSFLGVVSAVDSVKMAVEALKMSIGGAKNELNGLNAAATNTKNKNMVGGAGGAAGGAGAFGAGGGKLLKGLGVAMIGIDVAMQAKSLYDSFQGAGEGEGASSAATSGLANVGKRRSSIAGMVGTAIGGGIGFVLGAGAGAIPGAMIGGMAGSAVGQFLGPGEERTKSLMQMAQSLEGIQGLDLQGKSVESADDLLEAIRDQKDESVKIAALQKLRNDRLIDDVTISGKVGKELVDRVKQMTATQKIQEKENATAMAFVNNYERANTQLKIMGDAYSKIASYASSLKNATSENAFNIADSVVWAEKEAEALKEASKSVAERKRLLESFESGTMALGTRDRLGSMLGDLGINDDQKNRLLDAAKTLAESSYASQNTALTQEERNAAAEKAQAAAQEYNTLVKTFGVEKRLQDINMQNASTAVARVAQIDLANKKEREAAIFAEDYESRLKVINADINKSVAGYDAQIKMLSSIQEYDQARANMLGKTAAGYVVQFQAEKQVYDTIVKQQAVMQKTKDIIGKQTFDKAKEIEKAGIKGVGKDLLARALSRDTEAMNELEKVRQKLIGSKDEGDQKKLQYLNEFLALENKDMEIQKKLIALEDQRREKALALKEGYLDVINEMTTGSNMVSQLIADSSRGILALHQLQTTAAGGKFGGALSRGFFSINPLGGSMDARNFTRMTTGGLEVSGKVGSANTALGTHLADFEGPAANERANGPGSFRNADPNMSVLPEGLLPTGVDRRYFNRSSGGIIPGPPSSADNLTGVVDGKYPIGLASGEFVVNAKATKENIGLLKAINGGYADGGTISKEYIDSNLRAYWKKNLNSISGIAGRSGPRARARYVNIARDRLTSMGVQYDDYTVEMLANVISHQDMSTSERVILESKAPSQIGRRQVAMGRKIRNARQSRGISDPVDKALSDLSSKFNASGYSSPDDFSAVRAERMSTNPYYKNRPHALESGVPLERNYQKEVSDWMKSEGHKKAYERKYGYPMGGLATGGLASPSPEAMSILGGMRIGTLMLNGKVIGQDINGGVGSEWKIAAQNAYG